MGRGVTTRNTLPLKEYVPEGVHNWLVGAATRSVQIRACVLSLLSSNEPLEPEVLVAQALSLSKYVNSLPDSPEFVNGNNWGVDEALAIVDFMVGEGWLVQETSRDGKLTLSHKGAYVLGSWMAGKWDVRTLGPK